MKKLTNDPSRNVNAVSGMWVRLRRDGSKYDVRYVNASVKRVWSLSQTSEGTAWNVQAKGVQYEDFLNGMKSSSVDLEHGWLLVPDSERCGIVRVPVPTGMDAKRVAAIKADPLVDMNWRNDGERFLSGVHWPVPVPEDESKWAGKVRGMSEARVLWVLDGYKVDGLPSGREFFVEWDSLEHVQNQLRELADGGYDADDDVAQMMNDLVPVDTAYSRMRKVRASLKFFAAMAEGDGWRPTVSPSMSRQSNTGRSRLPRD